MAETLRAPIRACCRRATALACRRSVSRAALFALCACPMAAVSSNRAAAQEDWTVIAPAGETACAFDSPFEFWVREADPTRILVYLQGGGACWNVDTCHPERAIRFDGRIDSRDYAQRVHGVFDRTHEGNPFRDYTAVFVPYCTGDLHLGARRVTYAGSGGEGSPITVNHGGFHNVQAVLRYLATRKVAPSVIVVSGASAGAVASPVVADEAARLFPAAEVRQLGDGAAGLRLMQARTLLRHWGVDAVMEARGTPLAESGDAFAAMYMEAAARHPHIRFAQVATADDAVVADGLRLVGGDPARVSSNVDATYDELRRAGICFSGYVLPGTEHTILWRPDFLTARVSGRLLSELITREVLGEPCVVAEQGLKARDTLDAAFLFFYRPRHGMQAAFEQGYRRHLDWHRERADSLPWLAWTVVTGENPGMFVDGAFGISFKALDERVDPRGDAADAEVNVTAFADPISHEVYRLRRDLGSATPLESRQPGPMQEVVWLTLKPGSTEPFEQSLRGVAGSGAGSYTVYERVLGGALPAYLLVVQLKSWADVADRQGSPSRAVLRVAGEWLARAESEVWLYRPDLTYLPEAARAPGRPSSR